MTALPYRRWSEYWAAPENAPYDAAANSRDCYTEAIRAIRQRMIRDGEVVPYEGEEIDVVMMAVVK